MSTALISIDRIMYCVNMEIHGARQKFPASSHRLAAITEEVGELAEALLKNEPNGVFAEGIQVIAMVIRLLQEGDDDFPTARPNYESYAMFQPTRSKT